MKFESNGKNFSASMSSYPDLERKNELDNAGNFIKENKPFIFSVIAFGIAFANLIFGLFINLGSKILTNVFETDNYHLIVVMLVISLIMSVISVALGVFALAYYQKSSKESLNKVAVFVAILSFILSLSSIVLDIMGLLVW